MPAPSSAFCIPALTPSLLPFSLLLLNLFPLQSIANFATCPSPCIRFFPLAFSGYRLTLLAVLDALLALHTATTLAAAQLRTRRIAISFTHYHTHSLPLTHSPTHSLPLTHSLTHPLTHSPTRSLTRTLTASTLHFASFLLDTFRPASLNVHRMQSPYLQAPRTYEGAHPLSLPFSC